MNSRLLAMNWDMPSIHRLYMEAATSLHYLPPVLRKKHSSLWPSYALANSWSGYGYDNSVRVQPTTEDITRLEFALELGWELGKEDRMVLWYTCHSAVNRERGARWTRLAKRFHCDSRTVKAKYEKALIRVYYLIKGLQS